MIKTINGRLVFEQYSDSPVTRVRIKRNELVFRYSAETDEDREDDIYDTIIAIERNIGAWSPTVSIKILDTDDLNTIQCEIGTYEHKKRIIKVRGVDY